MHDHGTRLGARSGGALAVLILVLLTGLSAVANAKGVAARSFAQQSSDAIISVDTAKDLESSLRAARVHGAHAVIATHALRFRVVPIQDDMKEPAYPLPRTDIAALYRSKTDTATVLWVASQTGLIRRMDCVMTESDLEQTIQVGRAAGFPGIAADGSSIRANNDGYVRTIRTGFPSTQESVLLIVDASYFESGRPQVLLESIRASGLGFSAVYLYLAIDDASVSDNARDRAREFGEMWAAVDGGGE